MLNLVRNASNFELAKVKSCESTSESYFGDLRDSFTRRVCLSRLLPMSGCHKDSFFLLTPVAIYYLSEKDFITTAMLEQNFWEVSPLK